MDAQTEVTLISPAKVGDRLLKAGPALVTTAELLALIDAGAIEVSLDVEGSSLLVPVVPRGTEIGFDQDTFNAAVSVEARKLAAQAFDGELGKLEAEVKDLVQTAEKEKAELLSRLDETGKLLTAEHQKSAELAEKLTVAEAEITALKAAAVNTAVAKTAVKKGAATS